MKHSLTACAHEWCFKIKHHFHKFLCQNHDCNLYHCFIGRMTRQLYDLFNISFSVVRQISKSIWENFVTDKLLKQQQAVQSLGVSSADCL